MATAWTLSIDVGAANAIALTAAQKEVTDTTRRVLNRAIVLTPFDTGLLRANNHSHVHVEGRKAVGDVWNDTEYADAVHDGSKAYTIRPRAKKALRFEVNGQVVFAKKVTMPARRGRPWLLRALKEIAVPAGYKVTTP